MATYSFIIKKGKYVLELNTSDKELLSKQFEVWVNDAGRYASKAKVKACKDMINSQIKADEEVTKHNIEEQISRYSSEEDVEQQDEFVRDEANSELKSSPSGEKSEKNKNSASDIDIFYSPVNESIKEQPMVEYKDTSQSKGLFDNILENSIKNPQTELSFKPNPTIKKDVSFLNYINNQKIEKKLDYLLLTAYYFAQFEQMPRFTLKQLNSKLMQNIAVIIDHSILQEAINRDYIECLPDLTGLIGASEYRLTAYGEKSILDT